MPGGDSGTDGQAALGRLDVAVGEHLTVDLQVSTVRVAVVQSGLPARSAQGEHRVFRLVRRGNLGAQAAVGRVEVAGDPGGVRRARRPRVEVGEHYSLARRADAETVIDRAVVAAIAQRV